MIYLGEDFITTFLYLLRIYLRISPDHHFLFGSTHFLGIKEAETVPSDMNSRTYF